MPEFTFQIFTYDYSCLDLVPLEVIQKIMKDFSQLSEINFTNELGRFI